MKCPVCAAEMKALLTSVYCPLEDKHGTAPKVKYVGHRTTLLKGGLSVTWDSHYTNEIIGKK